MSELESILNYLDTTSMEPHDDYTSEFSYKEQKVLWKYIKQLQQENKKYKEVIDKVIEYISELDDNKDDTTCYDIDKNTRDYILSILKRGVE